MCVCPGLILSTVPTGSADMPPGEGSSTPGNVVDGDVPRRPRCRISRHPIEKMNPGNLEFVCANLGIYRVYICYNRPYTWSFLV